MISLGRAHHIVAELCCDRKRRYSSPELGCDHPKRGAGQGVFHVSVGVLQGDSWVRRKVFMRIGKPGSYVMNHAD